MQTLLPQKMRPSFVKASIPLEKGTNVELPRNSLWETELWMKRL
jgi:hypothetical protein